MEFSRRNEASQATKRKRPEACQDQLRQPPPQTRRMKGMEFGGALNHPSPLVSSPELDSPAAVSATSPPKPFARDAPAMNAPSDVDSRRSRIPNSMCMVGEDEIDVGHRLSYLLMRGYDNELLQMLDSVVYESDDEIESDLPESQGAQSKPDKYTRVGVETPHEVCYSPVVVPPAVVTPER